MPAGYRKVFQRTVVDSDGVVLADTSVHVPTKLSGEGFTFTYHKPTVGLLALDGLAVKVWLWCITQMAAGTGRISIDRTERLQLRSACGVKSTTSISNALKTLTTAGLLRRTQPGRYLVNPYSAWRGRVRTREAAIREWDATIQPPKTKA